MTRSEYSDFHLQIDDEVIRAAYLKRDGNKIEDGKSVKSALDPRIHEKIKLIEDEEIDSLTPKSYRSNHEDLGRALFSFLFPQEISRYFHDSYFDSKDNGKTGLRVRLETNQKLLSNIPWELAYDDEFKTYLSTEVTTPFTRYFGGLQKLITYMDNYGDEERPKQIITAKALFISANAVGDPNIRAELEYDGIKEKLLGIKGDIKIEQKKADPPSWETVHEELFNSTYNIVHFYGHGIFTEGKVKLIFESQDKKGIGDPVDPDRFATLFDRRKSRELCLILINACEGTKISQAKPQSGLPQALVTRSLDQVPAVAAMQFSIPADAASMFAEKFYGYISAGNAIDEAMQIARDYLYGSPQFGGMRFFATPVLFLGSPTGYIFDRLQTIQKPPSPNDAKEMLEALDNNYITLLKRLATEKDIKLEEFWIFENKGNLLVCLRFFQKYADAFKITPEQEKNIGQWLIEIPSKLQKLALARANWHGNEVKVLNDDIIDIYGKAVLFLLNLFKKYGEEARYRNTSAKLQGTDSNVPIDKLDAVLEFYNMINSMIYVNSLVSKCISHKGRDEVLTLIGDAYQKPIGEFKVSFEKWMKDLETIPALKQKMNTCHVTLSKKVTDLDQCFIDIKVGIDSLNAIMENLTDEFKQLWKLTITTMVLERATGVN